MKKEEPRGRAGDEPSPIRGPNDDPGPSDAEAADQPPLAMWEEEGGALPDTAPAETAESAPATEDYKDRWLRAEAELQNYRRRAQREWEEGRRAAEEAVLLEMVHVLDDLERALGSAAESGASESWLQGLVAIVQRLRDYLARRGVSVVDPVGQPFDPEFHEALLEIDPPENIAPGSVAQVVHKGYRRGSRALRAARVVVARHPEERGS